MVKETILIELEKDKKQVLRDTVVNFQKLFQKDSKGGIFSENWKQISNETKGLYIFQKQNEKQEEHT